MKPAPKPAARSSDCAACGFSGGVVPLGICPKCGATLGGASALPDAPHALQLRDQDSPAFRRVRRAVGVFSLAGLLATGLGSAAVAVGVATPSVAMFFSAVVVAPIAMVLVTIFLDTEEEIEEVVGTEVLDVRSVRLGGGTLHGRHTVQVFLSFVPEKLEDGDRLDMEVRLADKGDRGYFMRSALRSYRNEEGSFRARYRSPPLERGRDHVVTLTLAFPTHILRPPERARQTKRQDFRGRLHLRLFRGEGLLLEYHLPAHFPIEDHTPAPEPGIEIVASSEEAPAPDAPACLVCGDPMVRDLATCELCDVSSHAECWEYLGGCATYGCEGRPELAEGEPPPTSQKASG